MRIKIKMLGILGNTKKLIYKRTVLFIKNLYLKTLLNDLHKKFDIISGIQPRIP